MVSSKVLIKAVKNAYNVFAIMTTNNGDAFEIKVVKQDVLRILRQNPNQWDAYIVSGDIFLS